jgi:hypothetical protein
MRASSWLLVVHLAGREVKRRAELFTGCAVFRKKAARRTSEEKQSCCVSRRITSAISTTAFKIQSNAAIRNVGHELRLGGNTMHAARQCLRAFVLTAALATTASVVAATPKLQEVQVRVYDPGHKDYHNWDEREDRAYRHYVEERHEQYRKYDKLKEKEQRDYWNWRHSHPD